MRAYLLSIICCAFLWGILSAFLCDGFSKDLMKLLYGIFLMVCILRPLAHMDWEVWNLFPEVFSDKASQTAALGEEMAADAMADIIKRETEAYILDKAASLEEPLKVQVTLNENLLPESAVLTGQVTASEKNYLQEILERDLGITKEHQLWAG